MHPEWLSCHCHCIHNSKLGLILGHNTNKCNYVKNRCSTHHSSMSILHKQFAIILYIVIRVRCLATTGLIRCRVAKFLRFCMVIIMVLITFLFCLMSILLHGVININCIKALSNTILDSTFLLTEWCLYGIVYLILLWILNLLIVLKVD